VKLAGDEAALDELVALFPPERDPHVKRLSDGVYIGSAHFTGPMPASGPAGFERAQFAHVQAAPRLARMEAVRRSRNPRLAPVTLEHRVIDSKTGHGWKGASSTFTVAGRDATEILDPACVEFAEGDIDLADALRHFGGGEIDDWFRLWKVYEIIRYNVGGEKKLVAAFSWVTQDRVASFTMSANDERVSGEEARHARGRSPKGAQPMSLGDAVEFVRHLLVDGAARRRGGGGR
jgi:hypothetical protein